MKFIVSFLAVLAVTTADAHYGMPTQTRGLQEDLNKIRALIPQGKILEVILEYIMNDAEVQEVFMYLQSDEFEKLVVVVNSEKSYINFLNYIEKCGLPMYRLINKINKLLGLPELTPPVRISLRRGQGISGLVADVSALIPADKLIALHKELIDTSPEFAAMVERMKSDEMINLAKELMATPSVQVVLKKGKEHGVNLGFLFDIFNKVYEWGLEETYFNYSY